MNVAGGTTGSALAFLFMYRVIHKSLRNFRTRQSNNEGGHSTEEHILVHLLHARMVEPQKEPFLSNTRAQQ
jgi:hypothetical protein